MPVSIDVNQADSASAISPFVLATNARLGALYGSTMGYREIAQELRTTANAVKLRQFRFGDLPPRIPGLKCARWPTPAIAVWLCSLAGTPFDAPAAFAPRTTEVDTPRAQRKGGRPRLRHSTMASIDRRRAESGHHRGST